MSRASSRQSLWQSCRSQIPNALTAVRLLLLIPYVLLLQSGERTLAAVTYLVAIITDIDGTMASVSVPMPAARFYDDADTVVAALLRVRDEIQVALHTA